MHIYAFLVIGLVNIHHSTLPLSHIYFLDGIPLYSLSEKTSQQENKI